MMTTNHIFGSLPSVGVVEPEEETFLSEVGPFEVLRLNENLTVLRVSGETSAPFQVSVPLGTDTALMTFVECGTAEISDSGGAVSSTCHGDRVGFYSGSVPSVQIRPGTGMFVRAAFVLISGAHAVSASNSCFAGLGVKRATGALPLTCERSVPFSPTIRSGFDRLLSGKPDGPLDFFFLTSRVYDLIGVSLGDLFKERCQCCLSENDVRALKKARDILDSNLGSPPSIIELARMVGINDCKLKKGFKLLFQTTPFGYLKERRMMAAREELLRGDVSVTTVAGNVGYSNLGHFAAAFRKQFGITPKDIKSGSRDRIVLKTARRLGRGYETASAAPIGTVPFQRASGSTVTPGAGL